jgi:hypothetical protein
MELLIPATLFRLRIYVGNSNNKSYFLKLCVCRPKTSKISFPATAHGDISIKEGAGPEKHPIRPFPTQPSNTTHSTRKSQNPLSFISRYKFYFF